MSIPRITCAVAGLILIVATVTVSQFAQILPTVRMVQRAPVDGTAEIASTYQLVTAGPSYFYKIYVDVEYPSRVHRDETVNVHTIVRQEGYERDSIPYPRGGVSTDSSRPTSLKLLQWPIDISLDGAAFKIDPDNRSFSVNSILPLDMWWTAVPETTGNHTLLLDVSRIRPLNSEEWHLHTVASSSSVNGVEVFSSQLDENFSPVLGAQPPVSVLKLPVQVLTKWGISQLWVDVSALVVCFFGFLLTLPLTLPFLARKIREHWMIRRRAAP